MSAAGADGPGAGERDAKADAASAAGPSAPAFLQGELSEAEGGPGALFHVLPVPLERTVSYGAGTARGPEAILRASRELERICPAGPTALVASSGVRTPGGASATGGPGASDDRGAASTSSDPSAPDGMTAPGGVAAPGGPGAPHGQGRPSDHRAPGDPGEWEEPCRLGIHTLPALPCDGPVAEVMRDLRAQVGAIAAGGRVPVVLGGEHSLTYGAAMGVADALGRGLGVVQVDAHADLRRAYGGEPHSHASVMDLLAREGVALAQVGVRALCREELAARDRFGVAAWDALPLARGRAGEVRLPEGFPNDLYLSFDVDGLDPSVMPATGTPVPGGLGFEEALGLVERLTEGRRIVGLDVVELAPSAALPHCDFTAAQLAYRLMALAARGRGGPDASVGAPGSADPARQGR